MTPERQEQLCRLFEEARSLGTAEWEALLKNAPTSVRADVERMRALDEQGSEVRSLELTAAGADLPKRRILENFVLHRLFHGAVAGFVVFGLFVANDLFNEAFTRGEDGGLLLAHVVAVLTSAAFAEGLWWRGGSLSARSLRTFKGALVASAAAFILLFVYGFSRAYIRAEGFWRLLLLLSQGGTALTFATCAAVLGWRGGSLGMRLLRAIEWPSVVSAVVFNLLFHWAQFQDCADQLASQPAGRLDSMVDLTNESCTFRWCLAIIVYGMFIPNTRRRWAAVTLVLVLLPLLTTAAFGWRVHAPTAPVVGLIFEMALWLVIGALLGASALEAASLLRRELLETQRVGPYHLRLFLRKGGMGEVWLAEHELMKQRVAVKLIGREKARDPAYVARFEREVRLMAQLTHENTVDVFNYGRTEDGLLYYVMEYLPGLSLQELVDRHGPLPPGRVVHLLVQVCSALWEAHGNDLIHRDIKPSNIMLCERGRVPDVVKILDFGIAQVISLEGQPGGSRSGGGIEGTPEYMAPEQAFAADQVGRRSDIYSLGATASFLLTGQLLFKRESNLETIYAHRDEPPILPASIPDDLRQVLLRCLAKEPDQRFQDVSQLRSALKTCACTQDWNEKKALQWWEENPVGKYRQTLLAL
jgi:tRNA A-37 threonylcarbamoyl transferase component Bud32